VLPTSCFTRAADIPQTSSMKKYLPLRIDFTCESLRMVLLPYRTEISSSTLCFHILFCQPAIHVTRSRMRRCMTSDYIIDPITTLRLQQQTTPPCRLSDASIQNHPTSQTYYNQSSSFSSVQLIYPNTVANASVPQILQQEW
jgi:hypothetical protein